MNGIVWDMFSLLMLIIYCGYLIVWSIYFIKWVMRGCTNNVKPINKKPINKKLITDGYVSKSGRIYK